MGLHRDIESLAPEAQEKARAFLGELDAEKIRYCVIETVRTLLVQKAYYAQGRKPLEEINTLRRAAGLWEIGPEEGKRIITWTLDSRHLTGMALDLVPVDIDDSIMWNAPFETWEKIGSIGEKNGFEWGGRWKERDLPHFEVKEA
jgi:peptidoglycan L-alanyl-D-glutamate endopeptidase CwlK